MIGEIINPCLPAESSSLKDGDKAQDSSFRETGLFSDPDPREFKGTQPKDVKAMTRASWLSPGLLCQAYKVSNGDWLVQIVSKGASPYEMNPSPQEIIDMKASLRSKTVAVAPKDKSGPITLWGPDPEKLCFLFGHTVPLQALEWSPCGNRLASVATDRYVASKSGSSKSGFMKNLLVFVNKLFPMCVPSGSLEAYGEVGEVIVWDLEFLQPKFKYIIHLPLRGWELERIGSITWSPTCAHLACGGTNTIYIVDAITGAELSKAGDFVTGDRPKTLLWLPKSKNDDEFLVCGSSGDYVSLNSWGEKTGSRARVSKPLQIWKLNYNNGPTHFEAIECTLADLPQKTVTSLDWATDSNGNLIIAAASPGDSLKVWRQKGDDALSWECITTVADNGQDISWLSFLRKEDHPAVSSFESKTNVLAVVTSQNTRSFDLNC